LFLRLFILTQAPPPPPPRPLAPLVTGAYAMALRQGVPAHRSSAVTIEDDYEVVLNVPKPCSMLRHIALTMYGNACGDESIIRVVLHAYVQHTHMHAHACTHTHTQDGI